MLDVGVGVYSGVTVASCVMNASSNVGMGVTVFAVTIDTKGSVVGVCVTSTTGTGEGPGGTPPGGVGVAYCPHSDEALPPHEASRKVAVIKKLMNRFTKEVQWGNYTWIKHGVRSLLTSCGKIRRFCTPTQVISKSDSIHRICPPLLRGQWLRVSGIHHIQYRFRLRPSHPE
jgi:hypothetical protein